MKKVKKSCQTCKFQKNHPSFCSIINYYTPRKGGKDCGTWKSKK